MMKAPWTDEQVERANEYQTSREFHPYTCGGASCREVLVATTNGWVCPNPVCGYTQDWAHDFTLEFKSRRATPTPPTP
jgi:hypothetical protein